MDIGQAPNAWSKESLLALRWGLFKIELAVAEVDDLGAGVGEVGGLDAVEAAVASAATNRKRKEVVSSEGMQRRARPTTDSIGAIALSYLWGSASFFVQRRNAQKQFSVSVTRAAAHPKSSQ